MQSGHRHAPTQAPSIDEQSNPTRVAYISLEDMSDEHYAFILFLLEKGVRIICNGETSKKLMDRYPRDHHDLITVFENASKFVALLSMQ